MPSMNPATAPSTGLDRWRYVRTGGSALFTACRTSRRWTPNFRATPLIVPIPNSYSRRNCSNSSTFVLLSTPPLPLVQRKDGTPQEKGGPNSVSKVGRHPIANSTGVHHLAHIGSEGKVAPEQGFDDTPLRVCQVARIASPLTIHQFPVKACC